MAVDTFGGIKSAVADWSFSGGGVTATVVGTDIFPQVQSMMYRGDGVDVPALRISSMVDSATITPASGGIITISSQVDAGFLEFIELVPTSQGAKSIDYVPPWMFRKAADEIADTVAPQVIYTIEGDYVYLAPAAVQPITARWYQKFTALSADGDTDWIVTNAPQVYMNGCLYLACVYADDPRRGEFRNQFAASIKALNMNDQRLRSSGSFKIARPRSVA